MKFPSLLVLSTVLFSLAHTGCERHSFENTKGLSLPHGKHHDDHGDHGGENHGEADKAEKATESKPEAKPEGAPRETGI